MGEDMTIESDIYGKCLMPTYHRLPISFESGHGCWLIDKDKNCYLDAISGIAVTNLGHGRQDIAKILFDQATKLIHVSNAVEISEQESLGNKLCSLAGMERVFFCNSGAEANETAFKLARLHGNRNSIKNPKILVMEGAFHGRTIATLSATGSKAVQAGFEPLTPGFIEVPYCDIGAIERVKNQDVVAVLLEPVQGEGGVRPACSEYLNRLRLICDRNNWLLMFDEIQTGIGRTGQWFSFQHAGVEPDVLTLAKALGNGMPIGACLASGEASELFTAGSHGSTFGGNPLTCRVAETVLNIIENEGLVSRAKILGDDIIESLRKNLSTIPEVLNIRGQGLMIGIEFDRPVTGLVEYAFYNENILINVSRDRMLRILPALIMTDQEKDILTYRVVNAINGYFGYETACHTNSWQEEFSIVV